MAPTRREALAAGAALASGVGSIRATAPPSLTLSTFSIEITPPLGHPCMGGGVAPVEEIVDPLFAHGFVLSGLDKPAAFVALDWCEVRNGAYELFRAKIARAIGTEPVRVMLCALHQHDAPIVDLEAQQTLEKYKAKGAICDLAFLEKTVDRVAEAAKESLGKARRVNFLGTGSARVERVASNRRYVDALGNVHYNRMSATRDAKIRDAEEGTIDPVLRTLSFWDDDTPLLALSTYATHPMSYYGGGGVSADFVGLARKRRQADTPKVFQMYASGASGNVTAGKYNDGDPATRAVLADRMHAAMAAGWKGTTRMPIKKAAFRSVPLLLEARSSAGFSEAELTRQVREDPKPFGQCLAALGLSWKKRVDAGKPIDLPVLDFGSDQSGAAVVLLPAESYVEFQLAAQKLRAESPVLVAGYGECGPGYIPIERAWKEKDANLNDWCWVNPGSEKRMVDALEKLLS
jgi:hypothetical protein